MNPNKLPKGTYWAAVSHGIVDSAIPDTLKLLLWYCYDKPEAWTFSVPEVSRSLKRSPQCIRDYFRQFRAAKVFRKLGMKATKHGLFPIYAFDPARIDDFIKTQLKGIPEYDPECDSENNPETDVERNPDAERSDTDTDLPKRSNDTDVKKSDSTEGIPSLPLHQDSGDAASGGVEVGLASTSVASSSDPTVIQAACGNSNADGKNNTDKRLVPVRAPMIQGSASGHANTGAANRSTGQSSKPANGANGTKGEWITDDELDAIAKANGVTKDYVRRMTNAFVMQEIYGINFTGRRNGSDSE